MSILVMTIDHVELLKFGHANCVVFIYLSIYFLFFRLLVIFCVINMINYVDRGAMASNGVNGHRRTCDDKGKCTPGTGIQ